MFLLFVLVISCVDAQKVCTTNEFKSFTSKFSSYCVQKLPAESEKVFESGNELYDRAKCTTCCRVMFVSEYNFKSGKRFTAADDKNGETRYCMDEEFDDKRSVRTYASNYEQNILLRPINPGNELQYWEFAPYKMYTAFAIPKRVHDIRGGSKVGSTLIIWMKKAPLAAGTNNQRFVYVHPFGTDYYPEYTKKGKSWPKYEKHFYLPFYTSSDLCYSARPGKKSTWTGNKNLEVDGTSYQIDAQYCKVDDPKQEFVPIFA